MMTLFLVSFILALQPQSAQRTEAAKMCKEAKDAYTLGNFDRSANLYEQAYGLYADPDPIILYNAAQSHRLNKNPEKALVQYKSFVRESAGRKDYDVVRQSAQEKIVVLEELVRYRSYLKDKPNARNREEVEAKIQELEKTSPKKAAAALKSDSEVVDPFERGVVIISNHPTAPPKANHRLPWIGVGATAILTGATIVSGLLANAKHTDLQASCSKTMAGCPESEIDGLKTRALITNTLLGLSLAAGVGTGVLFYLDMGSENKTVGLSFRF